MACEQTLSVGGDIAAAVASAANDTEVCLNAGNYGLVTLEDISRAGWVTLKAAPGATVTMTPVVDNCSFVRLQDIRCDGAQLLNNASHHIEFINCTWVPNSEGIAINGLNDSPPATSNEIVFDGCTLVDTTIALWDGRFNIRGMHGVKVRNCLFGGSNNASEKSDGIMLIGGSRNTEIGPGNTFEEFHQETAELGEHIDAIQFVGAGTGTKIFGNYFRDCDVFIGAFDEATGATVENNVFDATGRPSRTEFQGMRDLIYRHNTWRGTIAAPIIDTPKVGDQSNQNNVIQNNIFSSGIVVSSCSGCTVDNNMFPSGGSGTNIIIGTPTFVGGASPTTYEGFALATGSAGTGAGSDGEDVGIVADAAPVSPPVIISPLTASGTEGQLFQYQIIASQAPTSYGATGLPAGFTINTATGLIQATAPAANTYSIGITATNAAGTDSETLVVTITAIPPEPPPPGTTATITYEPGFSGPTTITHGEVVTITGPGTFGTKPTGPPVAWDDASGPGGNAALLDIWDQAHPSTTSDVSLRIARRAAPFRGVSAPHSRTGRIIAGSHGPAGAPRGAFNGNNVTLMMDLTVTTPINQRIYASCWMRADPAWVFNPDSDNNFKVFHWADVGNPYSNNANVNYEYNPKPTNTNPTFKGWHLYNGHPGTAMLNDGSGNGHWAPTPDIHNPVTGWAKYEIISHYNSAGFTRVYENGRLVVAFSGDVDSFNATTRLFSFGGYGRVHNANNFRYFTDLYFDTTHARVMLLSEGSFSAATGVTAGLATKREVQIPTAWAPSSVQFQVNLGAFIETDTGQLFVVDANNTPIKVGSVTFEDAPPVDEVPEITSYLAAAGVEDSTFSYQITATESPTSFDATNLHTGLAINVGTGQITGAPTVTGDRIVPLTAGNTAGSDEEPLALVVRPVIPSVGTGEKPTEVGAEPEVSSPLADDLVVSWLFNEGDVPTPAVTAVNGGSGGTAYDITMDYAVTNNYQWVVDGDSFALRSVGSVNGEVPLFPATDLTTGTTFSIEFRYTPQGGNTTAWLYATGDAVTGSQGLKMIMSDAGKPAYHYSGLNHRPAGTFTFDTEWHVVISVNNGVGTWFVNGVQRNALAGEPFTGVPSLSLDRLFTNTATQHSNSFGGILNHMRIWVGRALTAPEAQSLFNDPYAMYGTASPTAPVISSSLTATTNEGEPFVYGIVASPLPDDYDAQDLPAGLVVDQALGIIFGTPTVNGVFPIPISASNTIGTDQETLVLTIDAAAAPPIITSALTAVGRQGVAFSYQITATPAATSYGASGLPAGLSINTATGLIDGTPTVNGSFTPTISATNADGTDNETLQLTIDLPFVVPTITSPLTAAGTVGQPFTYTITATGEPATFFYEAAPLPAGLVLNEEIGEITGTPTTGGDTEVALTVENEAGSDVETLVISIAALPSATPVITSPLAANGQVGVPFTYQITATEFPFAFSASTLPPGLELNILSGLISGVPTMIGVTGVVIDATNGAGEGPNALLVISIDLGGEPEIISSLTATAPINRLFAYQIFTTFTATTSYTATGLAPGLTLDTVTGRISGTPTAAGTFAIALSVSSIVPGEVATGTLFLTVIGDIPPPEQPGPIFIQPWIRPQG